MNDTLGWSPQQVRRVSIAVWATYAVAVFFLVAALGYLLLAVDPAHGGEAGFLYAVAGVLGLIAALVVVLATITRRALNAGAPRTRRLLVATGAVILVASVPVIRSVPGIVTALVGVVVILLSALPGDDR